MTKKGEKVAKRKKEPEPVNTGEPEKEIKRAKNENALPATLMSPTRKGVMKFSKLPPGLAYERFINPSALKLFDEVKVHTLYVCLTCRPLRNSVLLQGYFGIPI
jgi:hypothetical protein